jgi:CofD-related protein of GAK system
MVAGEHPLVVDIMDPMQKIIRNHLRYFRTQMPDDFDLRGASIGNLALVGGYLNNAHDIEPAIFLFSQLVEVRGIVRPVVDDSLHLAARLADGTQLIGQHRISGKEAAPIGAPITDIGLVRSLDDPMPVDVSIDDKTRRLIGKADLICYPMGSFYSSIVANLLPMGVGAAIAANGCSKIYIPNRGVDPETPGMTLVQRVEELLRKLRRSAGEPVPAESLLDSVLVDSRDGGVTPDELRGVRALGVGVIDHPLVTGPSGPTLDDSQVLSALLSLT